MELDLGLFKSQLQEIHYSDVSIRSYIHCIKMISRVFNESKTEVPEKELIRKHLYWMIEEKGISTSYQKQILISVQKYCELVLKKPLDLSDLYPKHTEIKLPSCISKSQILGMIDKTTNLKHKAIISLLYSGGLRLSDLLGLTLGDIDSANQVIHLRGGKDQNSRTIMLSPQVFEILQEYYKAFAPLHFVFEGQGGKAFTAKSVQLIVKQSAQKAGITMTVTPHCLRHSFATHLVESGVDLHHIQTLLGHQTLKSTEIYTLVSDMKPAKIISPIDSPNK